jgi:hypothetical protein
LYCQKGDNDNEHFLQESAGRDYNQFGAKRGGKHCFSIKGPRFYR